MKANYIKHTYLILVFAVISSFFVACNKDVLNKSDLTGIDPNIWNIESATGEFLAATYDYVMPQWPVPGAIHNTSDELNNATASILNGTLTGAQGTSEVSDIASANKLANDQYWWIYRCNVALQGINAGTMNPDVKARLKGQFFFLRGYIYFNLIRIYGGVPLVTKPLNPNNIDSLYTPRSKTSECVKQICADMDSATAMLPTTWPLATDGGRITRAVAAAYKGKTLLYWASPQFNPTDILSRWQDAYTACKAAYTMAQTDGYALYPASSGGLGNLFIDESTNNHERMMWRTYDVTTTNPTHGTTTDNITRPTSETTGGGGSNQPTWNLVQAFPSANGLPINNPSNTTYDSELYWTNRDPRFAQTIAYNGQIWNLSGKSNRRQWNYVNFLDDGSKVTGTGFYCRKICNPAIAASNTAVNSTSGGGSGMDWIELRFAEVLLNYAEAANGIGNLSEAVGLCTTLRAARGFSAGSYNYGLSVVTDRSSMFTFLLTEREIEFAMEGKRYWDLRRTRQFEKLTGTFRTALKLVVKAPYAAGAYKTGTGLTYIDVPDPVTGATRICDTINVNYRSSYRKFFTPSIISIEPTTAPIINYPATYYFYPLPSGFLVSNPAVQQTMGWPGGTFDPLQ